MSAPMPSQQDLESLRIRAEAGLKNRREAHDPEPVILEFSGSPKAGKTTTIDIVNQFFRRIGYKVWAPSEGASKRTPYYLRRDLVAFNAWSLNYAISELLLSFYSVDRQDIVILDRGPFNSLAWMGVLKNRGGLSDAEYEIIRAYAMHPNWMSKVKRVFLLTCSPDVSMARENDSKLISLPGTAMNEPMLADLLSQYTALSETFEGSLVFPISTTSGTSPLSTAFQITDHVLSTLLSAT